MPVPVPAVSVVAEAVRRAGLADFTPEQMHFLRFGRVVDTTRMREKLKFSPRYGTVEAFDDFVNARGLRRVITPERLASIEDRVLATLGAKGGDDA
jgi:UDP-glucose 4-epimerase